MFCYSYDEERFTGEFESREKALNEARENNPCAIKIWTGKSVKVSTKNFLSVHNLLENLQESACDMCGDAAEDWLFNVKEEKRQELAKLIEGFIDANWPVGFWLVDSVECHNMEANR